ncbi:hypothetical protein K4749_34765 [Streptomyces sp. TRM72054]|uniref:hypothetical protein n=1 Tax=Streptomyces sp. TRM72054 TaxID=2870562 RepID=UPI001C8CE05F|nr:hypothetical protein [Streptomyces sp. TRM72054]MBX9398608.1 hypothetical protein [Streptomyces sp. TRM72054]
MQTIRAKRDASDADLRLVLAGAATAVGGIGALLALIGSDSPLRGPFTLFFLLAAPAVAIAAALDGLDPLGRAIVALAGAIVVDMLVAQGLLALHLWSVRGGVAAVTVLSALTLLLVLVRRSGGRTARRGGS